MKKIQKIVTLVLGVAILLTFTNKKAAECIDNMVLLEKRHPGYYDYLSKSSTYFGYKNSLNQATNNLLTSVIQTQEFEDKGFQIMAHDDGSFTYSGTYVGENPTYIYPIEIRNLPSGDYILSDGGASIEGGIQMRIFGVNTLSDGSREYGNPVALPGEGTFHWDADAYEQVKVDVIIYPGFSSSELSFYPILTKEKYGEMPYQNAVRKVSTLIENQSKDDYVPYVQVHMDKDKLSELTQADWQILCNEAKFQKQASWISVDFGDGTGMQIKNNDLENAVTGDMDAIGRVNTY